VSDLQVSRWAGAFGVAGFVVFLVALPAQLPRRHYGTRRGHRTIQPLPDEHQHVRSHSHIARRPAHHGLPLVFLAGFSHLIMQARQGYQVITTATVAAR
jgi:hypothetical protein